MQENSTPATQVLLIFLPLRQASTANNTPSAARGSETTTKQQVERDRIPHIPEARAKRCP